MSENIIAIMLGAGVTLPLAQATQSMAQNPTSPQWMIGLMITATGVLASAVTVLYKDLKKLLEKMMEQQERAIEANVKMSDSLEDLQRHCREKYKDVVQ